MFAICAGEKKSHSMRGNDTKAWIIGDLHRKFTQGNSIKLGVGISHEEKKQ